MDSRLLVFRKGSASSKKRDVSTTSLKMDNTVSYSFEGKVKDREYEKALKKILKDAKKLSW